jgi:hypothetical protein
MRKGTLATQIASARSAGGDAFGNDSSVWDKFAAAEDRIDQEAIETEVDAAMRGELGADHELDRKIAAAAGKSTAQLAAGGPDDPLSELKAKMDAAKAEKAQKLLDKPEGESK